MNRPLSLPLVAVVLACLRGFAPAQGFAEYEKAPHHYYTAPVETAAGRLARGDFQLPPEARRDEKAALRAVLNACGVPEESQVLVFSKTSLQRNHIGPATPRAIYFSDDTYIGHAPGGLTEIAAVDPRLGPVFYTVDLQDRAEARPLRLDRPDSCMDCHGGSRTGGVPGVFIRSVYPDENGFPLLQAGSFLTDHTSPFAERWGGWYVTGRHGAARHMGNVTATIADENGSVRLDVEAGANRETLPDQVNAERYLQPGSDIVALMLLEHQTGAQSRLVEAAYALRGLLHRQREVRADLGEPPLTGEAEFTGSVLSAARGHVAKIVPVLLFAGEAKLPEGGVSGSPAFLKAFAANRRADPEGRSLKDLDLRTRLVRYRLSWQIHGDLFQALPPYFKEMIYRELWRVLAAKTPPKEYAYFDPGEREAIVEILRATQKDLPKWWRTGEGPPR